MKRKTKLNPYVAKVKGARNYALFDLLNGKFFSITPEGDVEELKKSLKELGLTFETEGTVPSSPEKTGQSRIPFAKCTITSISHN